MTKQSQADHSSTCKTNLSYMYIISENTHFILLSLKIKNNNHTGLYLLASKETLNSMSIFSDESLEKMARPFNIRPHYSNQFKQVKS